MENPFEIINKRLDTIEVMLRQLLAARPKPEKTQDGVYVKDLKISVRSYNSIVAFFKAREHRTKEQIFWDDITIQEVAEYLSERGLYQTRNVGFKSVTEILRAFLEYGIEIKNK